MGVCSALHIEWLVGPRCVPEWFEGLNHHAGRAGLGEEPGSGPVSVYCREVYRGRSEVPGLALHFLSEGDRDDSRPDLFIPAGSEGDFFPEVVRRSGLSPEVVSDALSRIRDLAISEGLLSFPDPHGGDPLPIPDLRLVGAG